MRGANTLNDGSTVADGSLTRTQDAENAAKLENVVPQPGISVPTILSANDLGSIKISDTCVLSQFVRKANCLVQQLMWTMNWSMVPQL